MAYDFGNLGIYWNLVFNFTRQDIPISLFIGAKRTRCLSPSCQQCSSLQKLAVCHKPIELLGEDLIGAVSDEFVNCIKLLEGFSEHQNYDGESSRTTQWKPNRNMREQTEG